MENVEQRVMKIVAEQLGVNESEVKSESSFVDDLGGKMGNGIVQANLLIGQRNST